MENPANPATPQANARYTSQDAITYLADQCNRLKYGQCQSLSCLRRGGHTSGPPDYDVATCAEREGVLALNETTRLQARVSELRTAVEAQRNALAAFMVSVQTGALGRTETNKHHAEEAFQLFESAMALAEKVRYGHNPVIDAASGEQPDTRDSVSKESLLTQSNQGDASAPCPECGGKGFVNFDGSKNNAFEGCDSDKTKPCPTCKGTGVETKA